MDLDDLRRRLARHDAERLAAELTGLAERDKALRRRLELLALEGDSSDLASALRRRVVGLKRSKRFIEYGESFAFARELDGIVESARQLMETDPASACSAMEAFLEADEATFNRVDDSSGNVGDVFADACRVFLQAAARARGDRDWVARLRELVQADDYGVRESLLEHADDLLSEHELRRLAKIFEEEARQETPDSDYAISYPLIRLSLVAQALRDPRLYERSVTLQSGRLNDLQRLDVARRYLEYGRPEEALQHLRSVTERYDQERQSLLAQCYEQTGRHSERIESLWRLVEGGLPWKRFEELLALLPKDEREPARRRARKAALEFEDVVSAADFLLRLGHGADADRLIAERRDTLQHRFYGSLTNLADLAREHGAARIEMFCYRTLLDDVLDESRNRAYGHAARYLRRLDKLDAAIDSYAPAVTHEEYVAGLRSRHGRKYSFWSRVDPG